MKNSKQYSQKIQKFYNSLKRKHGKVKPLHWAEPTEALIYAALSEQMLDSQASSVFKKLANHFVDWNDLRVARVEEIVEKLGKDNEKTKHLSHVITSSLYSVFNRHNVVSLKLLTDMGKRQAKQYLEKIDSVTKFMVNYITLTALQGHAIPLTEKMIDYLKKNELIHPDAQEEDIAGFLERKIPSAKAYEFYVLLRRESESAKKTAAKKVAKKSIPKKASKKTKKATKKTAKKTKTKRKNSKK